MNTLADTTITIVVVSLSFDDESESIIANLRFSKTNKYWTVMVFAILVLFCLAQNSGVFRIFEQLNSNASNYESMIVAELTSEASNSTASIGEANISGLSVSQAKDSEFKQCELSEKSLRVCLDEPPIMPLLVLLFIFPLIPLTSRVLQGALNVPVLPRPRRIHLSLCRFQE